MTTEPENAPAPVAAQPNGYRAYLLRCWAEHSEQPAVTVWRYSLEDPLTAHRHGFASLEALTAWLQRQVAAPATKESPRPGSPFPTREGGQGVRS